MNSSSLTPASLPPEVTVLQDGPESVRYVLPLRRLRYGKWISAILLTVGSLILVSTGWTIYVIGSSILNLPAPRKGGLGGFAFFFCVFGAPMTWGGFAPFWWGLVSFLGHREIEVKGNYLKTIERCGPFWRSKRWKVDAIDSFEIKPLANLKKGESPPPIDLAGEFNALLVHPSNGKLGMIAWGYPISMLVLVAQTLAARCNHAVEVKGFGDAKREERDPIYIYGAGVSDAKSRSAKNQGSGEVSNEASEEDDDFDEEDLEDLGEDDEAIDVNAPVSAPANTTILLESLGDGEFTITVPPAGVWKGSKGMMFFALLWCGLMGFMTVVIIIAQLNPANRAKNDMPWFAYPIFGLFWTVGIGVFLGALNMGRRRAAIALAGGQLMAIQTGIFGSKKREWPIGEIKRVELGPSGMEVNHRPINELQIMDQKDAKFGFLAERDDEELRWLAWEIRQALPTPSM